MPYHTRKDENLLSDTQNWIRLSGIYKAKGGETSFIIGNFDDDKDVQFGGTKINPVPSGYSYYFIDDVSIKPLLDIPFRDTVLCPGDTLVLRTWLYGEKLLWQDGSTADSLVVTRPGLYHVSWQSESGLQSDTVRVRFLADNDTLLQRNVALCEGETLRYSLDTFPASFEWDGGRDERSLWIERPGTYTLSIGRSCGTWQQKIEVIDKNCFCHLLFPNAFTPTGEGLNDTFLPLWDCPGLRNYRMAVYDRWGGRVFLSEDPAKGWSGKGENGVPLPEGLYLWQAEWEGREGKGYKQFYRSGTVHSLK